MNFTLFSWSLGSLTLYGYGLIFAIATAFVWLYLIKTRKTFGRSAADASLVMLWLVVFSVLVGRLTYCFFRRNVLFYDPMDGNFLGIQPFFEVWKGGLSVQGAFAGALLGAWVAAKAGRISVERTINWVAAPLALWMGLLYIGAYFAGEGYGLSPENPALGFFPLCVKDAYDEWYFSVFIAEGVAYLLLFLALNKISAKAKNGRLAGVVGAAGSVQMFMESLHRDNYLRLESNGFIRVGQLLALLFVVAALIALTRRDRKLGMKFRLWEPLLLVLTCLAVVAAEFYEKIALPSIVLYATSFVLCIALTVLFIVRSNRETLKTT